MWCARSLADENIIRARHCPRTNGGPWLALDGTVIKTRIDKKATNISVLAAIGVRRNGQKVLISIMNMGGESKAAWAQFLADLDARGLQRPELVIVDGAPGLEAALVALWGDDLPIQRCTVHKHRNLLAHAPQHMHEELTRIIHEARCSGCEWRFPTGAICWSHVLLSPSVLRRAGGVFGGFSGCCFRVGGARWWASCREWRRERVEQ